LNAEAKAHGFAPDLRRIDRAIAHQKQNRPDAGYGARKRPRAGPADKTRIIR